MAPILIERLVSVNSEDPAHPAENLLKNASSNKKWKCKMGEKQATVVLQLKEPTVINGIDVGNAHSAFVEILVGRSSAANDNFQVLLVASTLMTLKEAKDGTNVNGVRFFKAADLSKPTSDEKWDRIKIVCTQPFNKHVQYGLSFIVLHGPTSTNTEAVDLGRFALKQEDPDSSINVGSWFAKRKEVEKTPLTGAAAIREASSPSGIALGKNKKTAPVFGNLLNGAKKPEKEKKIPMMLIDDEDQDDSDKDPDYHVESGSEGSDEVVDEDILSSSFEDANEKKKTKRKTKTRNPDITKPTTSKNPVTPKTNALKRTSDSNGSVDRLKRQRVSAKPTEGKPQKPFNKLLEGVVLVISGYQNPLRGELRGKALSLGSKYKPDWDNNCTHLICAFPNTPKFNQVRGRGKIVKKDWIEDCHDRRKRLPWRRYALDRNDQGQSESEEEIHEENSATNSVSSIERGDRRRALSENSDGSDTEEEIERVRARQLKINTPTQPKKPPPTDPYDQDTDAGSEADDATADHLKQSKTAAALPLPPLLDMFENIKFYISDYIDKAEAARLRRYIIAYKGSIMETLSSIVKYFITDTKVEAEKVKKEFRISAVRPDWIWESNDEQRLLPAVSFEW